MKYSVSSSSNVRFQTNNQKEAKRVAWLISRDCGTTEMGSPNISDLEEPFITVYDNINKCQIASYNLTKKTISVIEKMGY